jgi:hypothetical protein
MRCDCLLTTRDDRKEDSRLTTYLEKRSTCSGGRNIVSILRDRNQSPRWLQYSTVCIRAARKISEQHVNFIFFSPWAIHLGPKSLENHISFPASVMWSLPRHPSPLALCCVIPHSASLSRYIWHTISLRVLFKILKVSAASCSFLFSSRGKITKNK